MNQTTDMTFHDQIEAAAALEAVRRLAKEMREDQVLGHTLTRSIDGLRNSGPAGEALAGVLDVARVMRP